ncbi:hypothetical protein HH303_08210 [Rhodospirillaceae bacterium KN72]|uniref:Uncharacterized protein n=1 Tax=Pacificispira spongiicola TaxID=2729598 RepID=A0A7Y0DZJ0_9PROT|nr:hypothetical protein [Pacificispira spongiicola]NMM44460.1 hypothetical protein [Pacificispira spongiicola]
MTVSLYPSDSVASPVAIADPQQCLTALFEMDTTLPDGFAETAILSWLISLPSEIDPARAAATLGSLPRIAGAQGGETGRISQLLREIARYPAEKLAATGRRGHRRHA